MTSITQAMKDEALQKIESMDRTEWTMWHNGRGHCMTRGFQTFVKREYFHEKHQRNLVLVLRVRQNMETGRKTFNFTAGIQRLTMAQAEELLVNNPAR